MSQTQPIEFTSGFSEFDAIIQEKLFFMDKTMFIKKFMESGAFADVILRPRRFGKSTNLTMLKSFFSLGANSEDFERFEIYKEYSFVKEHCGKYPVIYLDLKMVVGKTFEELFLQADMSLKDMIYRHKHELPVKDYEYLIDTCFRSEQAPILNRMTAASQSIYLLARTLYETHKQKPIILVDEYDSPLNFAFQHNFYEDASSFLNKLLGKAFKGTSDIIKKVCIMGIVEISGTGILSGINNLESTAIDDELYAPYFGFTVDEIKKYVTGNQLNDVLYWYNGYWGGSSIRLVNPWSFVKYLKKKKCKPYWVSTSTTSTLSSTLQEYAEEIIPALTQIISSFYAIDKSEGFKIEPLVTNYSYSERQWGKTRVLHFLILAGYLSYKESDDGTYGSVWISNQEMFTHWKSEIRRLVDNFYQKETDL